ncbi:MAG: S8 family serine peptidase [Chitinophagales bacterium]
MKESLHSKTPLSLTALQHKPFSGFVIIRFAYEYAYFEGNSLFDFAQKNDIRGLYDLLQKYKPNSIQRQVNSIPMYKLKELEERAKKPKPHNFFVQRSSAPLRSLSTYWRLDYSNTIYELSNVIASFNSLRDVELAYQELLAHDPTVEYDNDPHHREQLYWDAAPKGINAKWVWETQGIAGEGVGFIDLEQGWELPHADLSRVDSRVIINANAHGVNGYRGTHGTNTLGVVAATDNSTGIVGIAPSVKYIKLASHYYHSSGTTGHVANAIGKVLDEFYDGNVKKGDVLLIEVQRDKYPVEVDDADFCAIQCACNLGLIVIEAAGNGGHDLDEWRDSFKNSRLNQAHNIHFEDSGAIMVGASRAEPPYYSDHDRISHSNYGNRVDCYAWGENVATAGGNGDLSGKNTSTSFDNFTRGFGGTSAASAIIAGAAILLQSYYKLKKIRILDSYEMRQLLSNTGTAQGDLVEGHIGVMPDLKKIIQMPYLY